MLQHTLALDLRFHLHRKTGEVTRIMDRGTNALQSILSTVLFNIGEAAIVQLGLISTSTGCGPLLCAALHCMMPETLAS